MQPIGPLMHEHRLIERMVELLGSELRKEAGGGTPSAQFLLQAIDFFRTYADRCHHGKEEEILFRRLAEKDISARHRQTLEDLVQEHRQAREMVNCLDAALGEWQDGQPRAKQHIVSILKRLAEFYPEHIRKEDEEFFHPVMGYFSKDEQLAMLQDYREFELRLMHDHYTDMVEGWERAHRGDESPKVTCNLP